jgi:glycosyltransferase involved in cell wall biosynthesis
MIRYAALTPSLAQPGGAERTILIMARYADPARMACTGIAISAYGVIDPGLGRELVRYTTLHGDPYKPRHGPPRPESPPVETGYRSLNEAIRHVCREADVLITWGSLAMGRFTADLAIPVVCVSHCSNASGASPLSGITHLVAVSGAARGFFAGEHRGAESLPVRVIPNGVEVDRTCPRRGRAWQRAAWGVAPDDKVLLYLGRHAPDKNPGACLRAMTRLPDDHRLILLGNQSFIPAEPWPRLVEEARDLGVADRVRFLPPTPFVGDALAGADCLLHLSVREADSLVIKEAFLAGLPVVHTRVGSIPELEAEFGAVGFGVDFVPGLEPDGIDPAAVARQVVRAVAGGGAAIVAKMRAVAWDRWTGPAMCERWADYLEEIVAAWNPPATPPTA